MPASRETDAVVHSESCVCASQLGGNGVKDTFQCSFVIPFKSVEFVFFGTWRVNPAGGPSHTGGAVIGEAGAHRLLRVVNFEATGGGVSEN